MLSGWSTQGKIGCPYCMEDTKTFVLKNGQKVSYFGCHRHFLSANHPYQGNARNFYRDRIDFDGPIQLQSAQEVFDRVQNLKYIWEQRINEVLDSFGVEHNWTKKSIFWQLAYWVDMKLRHNLDVMHIEKNVFENLFNTIMDVKGKTKDDGVKCKKDIGLYCRRPELELKTYRGRLVANKDICASALHKERMEHWQNNIAVTLCKLETIFPPSFFDSMEHLPIHLADEVLLGGPVHYCWMYPFEHFIYRLKQLGQKGNRAEVEASIVNAYVQLETSYLGSDYLDPELTTIGVWELGEALALPQWIHYLSTGFQSDVVCSITYKVNNYKFHIESHGEGRNTVNSHVYVKGTKGTHYYWVIEEIIHMRCGTNHRLKGWVAICPVKPTNAINMEVENVPFQDEGEMGTEMPVLVNVIGSLGDLADDEVYEYDTEEDGNDEHIADNLDTEEDSNESS
ncbi:hypothetical protein QQ045_003741 [Rhodiola kirilowii]